MPSSTLQARFRSLAFAWDSKLLSFCDLCDLYQIANYTRQCIFSVFGGDVTFAGEILHGKTSPLSHDGKGVYAGLPQGLPVTRYHSLAGTHQTLPEALELTSWIDRPGEVGSIIMGVRHKEYTIEGVQFHPESILTEQGRLMFKNFLHIRGGTWAENEKLQKASPAKKSSHTKADNILERIFEHRQASVALQKTLPSQRPSDLQEAYDLGLAPPLVSFVDRLRSTPFDISLMAEIKRASPSKGDISMDISAPAQAKKYALAGASVISVLTEPEWFKGSIDDLRYVRKALEGMPNRPAILRKEFIFEEYQILEARLAGADTVLLIVKMLPEATIKRLFEYSRSLGMEPLVEVNTANEMDVALRLGAKVIGVNNRNLTTFEVDLNVTNRMNERAPLETIVCALSGISKPEDLKVYKENAVGAVLIGEALMRAKDTAAFIRELLGSSSTENRSEEPLLVKICGTRTAECAKAAVEAGADLIGMILVPARKRTVSPEQGKAISQVVHSHIREQPLDVTPQHSGTASDFFAYARSTLTSFRPLLVGVFQNQPLDEVLRLQKYYDLDVVQLHGNEPLEWASLIPVPVIKSFKPRQSGIGSRGYHAIPLLDSAAGGTGEKLDMSEVRDTLQSDDGLQIIFAGGLDPTSVVDAVKEAGDLSSRIIAVDVSSGVEVGGAQSIEKIRAFIAAAKSIR